jgi:photosystem II stability/assembly factor-like uncharacterized protein
MPLRAALGAALLVIVLISAAPVAHAREVPSRWSWTDYGPTLRDVSCSSPGVCVAVGQRGVVLRSTPGTEVPLAWSRVPLTYPVELDGVTCTEAFCLAVSNTLTSSATYVSKVFRSVDGGATWSDGVALGAAGAARTRSALAVACAPGGACYAVGPGGGVWRSLDQGRSWRALNLPNTPASFRRVACPAAGTCVAVGGDSVGSSAVIKGTKVTLVDLPRATGNGILALACDSAKRCTATDGLGHFMSLSIPDKIWGRPKLFPKAAPVSALACPLADVCVGLAESLALRTTSLSSATGGWHRRPLGTLNLQAITCARTTCTAVGKAATWFASLNVGFGWGRVNEVGKFNAIQCPATFSGTCVAGGEKDLGVSHSGGDLWSLPLSGYTGLNIKAVNCTGPSECLFLGKTLSLFSTDLTTFAARHPTIADPRGTDALTCITKDLCVGINEGVVYTTLDGAVTDWNQNAFPDKATSVACLPGRTAPAVCVATTRDFLILGTMTQAGGQIRWNWRYTDADPSEGLEAVGCSPGGQCTAVGGGGEVLTSVGTDLMRWTELVLPNQLAPVDARPLLKSVACPADGVCLAGGVHGPDAIIASTTNNWADFSYQKIPGIEGAAPTITSFGCETVDRCVGVGSTALVGVRNHSHRTRSSRTSQRAPRA